jgi:hypothetical protein
VNHLRGLETKMMGHLGYCPVVYPSPFTRAVPGKVLGLVAESDYDQTESISDF